MAGGLNPKAAERRKAQDVEQARCAWLIASDLAAGKFGADVRVVMQTRGTAGRGGDDKTSMARKVACYLALVVANSTGSTLSKASGIDRSTIHVHAAQVEDMREVPAFDQLVADLEDVMTSMACRVVMAKLGLAETVALLAGPA